MLSGIQYCLKSLSLYACGVYIDRQTHTLILLEVAVLLNKLHLFIQIRDFDASMHLTSTGDDTAEPLQDARQRAGLRLHRQPVRLHGDVADDG